MDCLVQIRYRSLFKRYLDLKMFPINLECSVAFKYAAQNALFKDPVRTAQ